MSEHEHDVSCVISRGYRPTVVADLIRETVKQIIGDDKDIMYQFINTMTIYLIACHSKNEMDYRHELFIITDHLQQSCYEIASAMKSIEDDILKDVDKV